MGGWWGGVKVNVLDHKQRPTSLSIGVVPGWLGGLLCGWLVDGGGFVIVAVHELIISAFHL